MRAPFPSHSDQLQAVRVGLAMLLTGSAVLFSSTIAMRLYSVSRAYEQQRIDQIHQAILTRVDYLKSAQNYSVCIAEAQRIPVESLFYSQAKTLQDQCQAALSETTIQRAMAMAALGQFSDAIVEVQSISDGAVSVKVQQLVWEWSNRILQIAEGYYLDSSGKLQDAISIAEAITPNNPLYNHAQAEIRRWQDEWAANRNHLQAAQAALQSKQADRALSEAQQVTHPYWSQQATVVINAAYAQIAEDQVSWKPKLTAKIDLSKLPFSFQFLLPVGVSFWLICSQLRR